MRQRAAAVSAKAKDIVEFLSGIELPAGFASLARHLSFGLFHAAWPADRERRPRRSCAMRASRCQDVPEGHLCCGSAGTYNILQPEIATQLRDRKIENIKTTNPQVIATGNIGCITQLATGTGKPHSAYGRAARLGLWRA